MSSSSSSSSSSSDCLREEDVQFANSWLTTQFDPASKIYTILEKKLFDSLELEIFKRSQCDDYGSIVDDFLYSFNEEPEDGKITKIIMDPRNVIFETFEKKQYEKVLAYVQAIANFQWSVFGTQYFLAARGTCLMNQ